MSAELLLIVDDASSAVSHGGGRWSTATYPGWYGGSSTWPNFATGNHGDSGIYGSLLYTFSGTSIAFVGNTPPSKDTQSVAVTIDDGVPYNTSYDDPNPQNYRQWYQSPHLDDGTHTIQLNSIAGTSVDFMVISVGPSTPLVGQKVIVDDDDPSIIYSGSWTRNGSPFLSIGAPNGFPFHNGTHQSTTPGDTATIHFTGNSIALYGIFSWAALGSMSVTYTLDGSSSVISYDVGPWTPEFTNHTLERQNYILFSSDSFAPGDHTLVINVTEVVNLTFTMDYLTYSPSFASLATRPNLTTPLTFTSLTPTSSTFTSPDSPPSGSPLPTAMATGSPAQQASSAGNELSIGGIASGVVGAVIALMLALFIMHNRRRSQAVRKAGLESEHRESGIELHRRTAGSFTSDDKWGSSIDSIYAAGSSHPSPRGERAVNPSFATNDPQRATTNLQQTRAADALIRALEAPPKRDRVSQESQIRPLRQRIEDLIRGA